MAEPATTQGRATRNRIVRGAARLIARRGPAATSLDDVRDATKASKSQLYHYFGDKQGLVHAVVEYQGDAVLGYQIELLRSVERLDDLDRWAEAIVAAQDAARFRGGCPIGTLAAELADSDDRARRALAAAFDTWRTEIADALERLRANGELDARADLDALAVTTLAAVEGGLLLAKTHRSSEPLRTALDGALAHIRASAPRRRSRQASPRAG